MFSLNLNVRPRLLLQEANVLPAPPDDEPDLLVRDGHRGGDIAGVPAPRVVVMMMMVILISPEEQRSASP